LSPKGLKTFKRACVGESSLCLANSVVSANK
jgi:hypothetical protein